MPEFSADRTDDGLIDPELGFPLRNTHDKKHARTHFLV